MTTRADDVLAQVWRELTPDCGPAPVRLTGPDVAAGSAFRVADAAAAAVGAALGAHVRLRGGGSAELAVAAALDVFRAEQHLRLDGERLPAWDPLAGDHRAGDGWVRLHTNYAAHRAAALRALDLPAHADRGAVAQAVAVRPALAVEEAVVAAGGAAAALRTRQEWRDHPQAQAVAARPLVTIGDLSPGGAAGGAGGASRAGTGRRRPRVLDLTRVIAGPTATKVLAALGADVLRLDAPGFEEVAALVPETTAGKRCAHLDLRSPAGRVRFEELVREADVLVDGLRPGAEGALARLGWDRAALTGLNPALVLAELSAYGDTGPWAGRRGFDSLVQTVCGIAAEGAERAGSDRPVPLPVQALDHASGWFLAAGVLEALRRREADGRGRVVGVVLARTGQWLDDLGRTDEYRGTQDGAPGSGEPALETITSVLGEVTRARFPGTLDGVPRAWAGPPVPFGSAPASFAGDLPG